MIATADAIREALIADGFDRPAYDELVTHNPSALTDRECGAVLAWALLAEVDRLTIDRVRLIQALEWALGEGAAPPHAEGDGVGKGIPLTPCQMHVFAIEERRFAARQILNDVRSEVPRARPG